MSDDKSDTASDTMPWDPNGPFTRREYKRLIDWAWRQRNKEHCRQYSAKVRAKNRDVYNAHRRALAAAKRVPELFTAAERKSLRNKAWHKANPAKSYAIERAYKDRHRERLSAERKAKRQADPEKYRAAELRRRHAAPGREAERVAARRTRLLKATPPWVDRNAIRQVYEVAAMIGWQVDHIHPLKGRNFCGLHVPWNLQLLPAGANASKGNRLPEVSVLSVDKSATA